MRFKITLGPQSSDSVIPINYQYPLSAVIYKVLAEADDEYATFLHEKGYQVDDSLKRFKLFSFSDLQAKFKLRADRMHLLSNPELIISFHLPEAAQHFIKGLFMNREIDIADQKSKANFLVEQVQTMSGLDIGTAKVSTVEFGLRSMVICGKKNEKGEYEFLSPEHRDWDGLLLHNWKEKCKAAGVELSKMEGDDMKIEPIFKKEKPKSRLIVIKANTKAQTRIKEYYEFGVSATAPKNALEVLYNSGCGVYNSLGCGCVEVLPRDSTNKNGYE